MATDVKTLAQAVSPGNPCVIFHGIGWKGYLTLLRLRGERSRPRMIYLDGDLWLMSPAFYHEHLADRLSTFVKEVTIGLGIRCVASGRTTFRRRKKDAGVEGDATYYLAEAQRLRGLANIDLRIDPPPDLAIEAVNTHGASKALTVYRRLGVPEVWVADRDGLRILALQANGRYVPKDASAAFPFLTAAEIADWLYRPFTEDETQWGIELREWVRDTLVSRHLAAGAVPRPEPTEET